MAQPSPDSSAMEKAITPNISIASSSSPNNEFDSPSLGAFRRWNDKFERFTGLESRGITRVMPDERHAPSTFGYVQMALLWFSANISANNLAVGFLGPLVYQLSFLDAALCAVFGSLLGAIGTAYMGTWGPQSGNRTMIVARYFMGYYPSKICALLNIILLVGFGVIDCVVGGQILSAVADGNLSIVVGIVIVALISWVVATFGMSVFHLYERWAWLPQLIVLFILVGSAGPKFDTAFPSQGDATTVAGHRLSFFSLCLSVAVSWAPSAADYYVYYPESTAKWKTFGMSLAGLTFSFVFVTLLGVGLASGTLSNTSWNESYNISSGALILAGYDGLGGFGKFCGVIVALGVIANNVPGTYSAALDVQALGRYVQRIPRWISTTIIVIIYTACALGGRDHLFVILQNFLALVGYWVMIFISIVLEEHFIFKRNKAIDWNAWDDWRRLPVGLAALAAFLLGWAGAIISMDQVYYVGPVAKMVGKDGADLGIWVGCGFSLVAYPLLRVLELKTLGR